jgi:protein phosphatase PTC7
MGLRFRGEYLDITNKAHSSSQDAWSYSEASLIVADGVGGWSDRGIDPAIWAHVFMCQLSMCFSTYEGKDVLQNINDAMARTRVCGSSTLSLIHMDPVTDIALAYNIGDSCWFHIRDGMLISSSTSTLHSPGFPFQLGRDEDGLVHDSLPEDGVITQLNLQEGDLVGVATDGLTKLLPLRLLVDYLSGDEDLEVSMGIMTATILGLDKVAQEHDDITVVVAKVVA